MDLSQFQQDLAAFKTTHPRKPGTELCWIGTPTEWAALRASLDAACGGVIVSAVVDPERQALLKKAYNEMVATTYGAAYRGMFAGAHLFEMEQGGGFTLAICGVYLTDDDVVSICPVS
jgi:hypothetical protein